MKTMGRPKVDNPKQIKFSIRLDAETHDKLMKYADNNNITKTEAIRKGIETLLDSSKKNNDHA